MSIAELEASAFPEANPTSKISSALLVVLVSAAVLFVNNGFIILGLTAFDSKLLAEFHSDVAALKARDFVTFGTVAVAAPAAGWLLDRIGVRPLLVAGMLLMATGFALYSIVGSLPQIYGIHVLFGLCLVTSGLFANVILVAACTHKHRGLALGFIIAGSSLGQALAPRFNTLLGSWMDWRHVVVSNAMIPLVLIPFILLIVPKIDWHADGPGREAGVGMTYGEALRHRNFWLLSFIAMVGYCTQLGVVSNTVLFVQNDMGGTAETGGTAVFCIFMGALFSQVCFGWLADRFNPKVIHVCTMVIMASGFALMAMAHRDAQGFLWAGAITFGLGWGGNYSLIQLVTSNLFLGPALGRIIGTLAVIESVGAAMGPISVGKIYDVTGSYSTAFAICSALVISSILAVLLMSPARIGNRRPS